MCKNHDHEDEEHLQANNMAAAGIIIIGILMLLLIYNEFADHHAMERINAFFEDTGLHEVEPAEQ